MSFPHFFISDHFSSVSAEHEDRFDHIFTHIHAHPEVFFFLLELLKFGRRWILLLDLKSFSHLLSSYLNSLYFLFSSEIKTNYSPFSLKVLSYFAHILQFFQSLRRSYFLLKLSNERYSGLFESNSVEYHFLYYFIPKVLVTLCMAMVTNPYFHFGYFFKPQISVFPTGVSFFCSNICITCLLHSMCH